MMVSVSPVKPAICCVYVAYSRHFVVAGMFMLSVRPVLQGIEVEGYARNEQEEALKQQRAPLTWKSPPSSFLDMGV